jgi:asparagine N-glycosylation enzyme membrane subunit Stt3
MRINDIFGKRCFTKKEHVFALVFAFIAIFIWTRIILKITIFGFFFHFWLTLLFSIILCAYPSSPNEREEMPIAEYKLPKKTIIALLLIIFVFSGLALRGPILFCHNTEYEWWLHGLKCPLLR